ncbi:hypothetical protein IWW37_001556 [Coemansia sp. RSA 2050]|nr:hypothetical protein IWW37_001556 [Coemansia sp. RSA 2050]KAJ2736966.1 hypothetical protein IW152_000477 [Coemansia sp. BCRC 34962]
MAVEPHSLPLSQPSSDMVNLAAAAACGAASSVPHNDVVGLSRPSDTASGISAVGERQQQVKQSIVTLERNGYRLRSIDFPHKSIYFGFDGSVCASDEATPHIQPSEPVEPAAEQPAIVHAIVGTFALDSFGYVLVVTDSRCQGTIAGSQVYEITSVSALPLSSGRAKAAFASMLTDIQKANSGKRSSTPQGSDEGSNTNNLESASATLQSVPKTGSGTKPASTASLGWISPQFTKFFGRGRTRSASSILAATSSIVGQSSAKPAEERLESLGEMNHAEDELAKTSSSIRRMEDRVLDEISRLFGDTGMLFSYTYDLTRSLQGKSDQALAFTGAPTALVADVDYWFNHSLQQSLVTCGDVGWAVPIVQGSIQMATCEVSGGTSFQVCVLSRRNRQRIGMRYERRGANEQGHVANFVETEQILTVAISGQQAHYASFVQTRGSMPFFWKQPPNGLHPAPVVLKGDDENTAVCTAHLQREIGRWGRQVLINLVEHKGREAGLGAKYATFVGECVAKELVDASMIRYIPWDFHHETRGMHYERLELLLEQLKRETLDMCYHWRVGEQVLTRQSGVFRVNCMDCLDRTNVVQSTIARSVLNEQLVRLGVHIAPERGLAAYQGLEVMVNYLWANNGDYISRQYAGTMAMKGDFTRTGKRNFSGLMNDASYSLARLWISTFRDYFSQSVLDFALGNQKASDVFRTIVDLRSREPDYTRQLSRAREAAIKTSTAIVVHDGECVLLACIVHTPMSLNTLKVRETADAVMVLTDRAVYICSYDYQLEKVLRFQRIELESVSIVQHGAYVTDILAPHSLDQARNYGFLLYFATAAAQPDPKVVVLPEKSVEGVAASIQTEDLPPKVGKNTLTQTTVDQKELSEGRSALPDSASAVAVPMSDFLACKLASEAQVVLQSVVASSSARALVSLERLVALENQLPELLAECLCSAILSAKLRTGPVDASQFIVESPIISAAAAKEGASLVDKMSNRLHKVLWI